MRLTAAPSDSLVTRSQKEENGPDHTGFLVAEMCRSLTSAGVLVHVPVTDHLLSLSTDNLCLPDRLPTFITHRQSTRVSDTHLPLVSLYEWHREGNIEPVCESLSVSIYLQCLSVSVLMCMCVCMA